MIPERAIAVIQSVCEAHGVTVDDIVSGVRRFYRARHEVFARLRKEIVMHNGKPPSYPLIGRWIGHDHTSVIYGEKMYYERKKKVWTEEAAAKVIAMKNNGATAEEIAEAIGKTRNAVYIFLSRARNRDPDAPKARRTATLTEKEIEYAVAARERGKSFVTIGRQLKRDPRSVSLALRERGYKPLLHTYTPAEDAMIAEMYRAGKSNEKIAEAIGNVTDRAISQRVSLLGLVGTRPTVKTGPRKRTQDPMLKNITPRESGSWDSRTFLPYAEWKKWRQEQRKMMEQERVA